MSHPISDGPNTPTDRLRGSMIENAMMDPILEEVDLEIHMPTQSSQPNTTEDPERHEHETNSKKISCSDQTLNERDLGNPKQVESSAKMRLEAVQSAPIKTPCDNEKSKTRRTLDADVSHQIKSVGDKKLDGRPTEETIIVPTPKKKDSTVDVALA